MCPLRNVGCDFLNGAGKTSVRIVTETKVLSRLSLTIPIYSARHKVYDCLAVLNCLCNYSFWPFWLLSIVRYSIVPPTEPDVGGMWQRKTSSVIDRLRCKLNSNIHSL
jgi:hypothetical protein